MSARLRLSGRGDEFQCHAIDAVPLVRRRRPIVEHVPQVPAAARAVQGRAHHSEGRIAGRADRVLQRAAYLADQRGRAEQRADDDQRDDRRGDLDVGHALLGDLLAHRLGGLLLQRHEVAQ